MAESFIRKYLINRTQTRARCSLKRNPPASLCSLTYNNSEPEPTNLREICWSTLLCHSILLEQAHFLSSVHIYLPRASRKFCREHRGNELFYDHTPCHLPSVFGSHHYPCVPNMMENIPSLC